METVLFTRQRHEADRAGLHYDYRLVVGDIAHSWATKKEMPEPGKSILLWQQPVHSKHYALSERVEIPKGQYGAGTTTLDWVKKGKAELGQDKIVIHTEDGRFLLKKMPENYGEGAWLFRHLEDKDMEKNKYLEKVDELEKKAGFLSTGLKNAAKEVGQKSPTMKDALLDRIASKGFNGKRAYINGVRTEVGKSLSTGTSHGSAFKQALLKVK